jgi:hypothetical protein
MVGMIAPGKATGTGAYLALVRSISPGIVLIPP